MKFITRQQLDFYQEEGYLIVEDFLSATDLDRLKKALQRLEDQARNLTTDRGSFNLEKRDAGEGSWGTTAAAPGVLRKISEITDHSPEFAELLHSDRMLDCVEDLIGPTIYFHHSKLMFKPARHGGIKPWHQDYAYWPNTKPEQVTCWMALDDATPENGCMQLIPGWHKRGLIKHIREELQVDPANLPLERVKLAPMRAGSLLAFHVLTPHFSGPNRSDRSRRALILDFDPNPYLKKGSQFPIRLLRIDGRKPTQDEFAAALQLAPAGVAGD